MREDEWAGIKNVFPERKQQHLKRTEACVEISQTRGIIGTRSSVPNRENKM